jgi:response regulator of citrate/malate metabolism
MENQHRLVRGYRELSQAEINLMNKIKAKGEELGDLVQELQAQNLQAIANSSGDVDENTRLHEAGRWLSIGKTHLQQGLMALTRAVAKPTFF